MKVYKYGLQRPKSRLESDGAAVYRTAEGALATPEYMPEQEMAASTVGTNDYVSDQMREVHRYRNELTEIERDRRIEVRKVQSSLPELYGVEYAIGMLEGEYGMAVDAIKKQRATTRSRSETAAMRKVKAEVLGRLKRAKMARRVFLRMIARPLLTPAIAKIDDDANERRKAARAATSAYWGTYLLAEDAVDRVRKTTPIDKDPSFSRWTGEGSVGVQLQGGLSCPDVMACDDTRLRIEKLPPTGTGGKRSHYRAILWMRVGSIGRAAVWAKWPMVLHRPLPEGGVVKRAIVHRRLVGRRERWSVDLTVDAPPVERRNVAGAVALNFGWRRVEGGLRVARWLTPDGEEGELVLPDVILSGLSKADELRGVRDMHMDRLRAWLLPLRDRDDAPAWFVEATSHLHLWRSPKRFAHLQRRCLQEDCPGDIRLGLSWWRYRDTHLWDWEASQRSKSLLRRRDFYRCFARKLANRYRMLIVDNFDLRDVAKLKDEPKTAPRLQRVRAAIHELRSACRNAFGADDVAVVLAAGVTITCHICQGALDGDPADGIMQHCANGHVWDQDLNAAANCLQRFREQAEQRFDAQQPKRKKRAKKEGKWSRLKREKAVRDEAATTARNALANTSE